MAALALPAPPLSDGVVTLRPFVEADADAVAVMMDDAEMANWTRTPWPYERHHAVEWLAGHAGAIERAEELNLAIIAAGSGELSGSIGLRLRDEGRGEFGYLVARWARRRGVGSRALRLFAGWAFSELGLERLEVYARPENAASLRMAEQVGFQREGLLRAYAVMRGERRDMVAMGLLPGELRSE